MSSNILIDCKIKNVINLIVKYFICNISKLYEILIEMKWISFAKFWLILKIKNFI